jgi:hypothetical protein
VVAFQSLKSVAEKLKRNHRTAALWRTAVKLSRLTFTEALLLRIAFAVSLATLLFYEIVDLLLRLMGWS